jgi:phosphodiester glycosidase
MRGEVFSVCLWLDRLTLRGSYDETDCCRHSGLPEELGCGHSEPERGGAGWALRDFTLALYVSAVLLGVIGAVPSSVRGQPPRFLAVAPGIAHATFEVSSWDIEPFSGHAFKIDLEVTELRLVSAGGLSSRRTVAQIVGPYLAVVAVNASFFDTDGRAMGLAVDEGRLMAPSKLQGWGALVVDGTKARIVLSADIHNHLAHRLIVQGIPRLVIRGTVPRLKPQVAERTAVCAEGSVLVIVVATKAETTTFARFLADPPEKGGLGCSDALNLDGGPSTQLVVKLPALTLSPHGGSEVPNALVVTPGGRAEAPHSLLTRLARRISADRAGRLVQLIQAAKRTWRETWLGNGKRSR